MIYRLREATKNLEENKDHAVIKMGARRQLPRFGIKKHNGWSKKKDFSQCVA